MPRIFRRGHILLVSTYDLYERKSKKFTKIKTKKLSDSKIKIFPSKTKQSIDLLPGSSDDSAKQTKIADPVPDLQSISTEYIAELHQIIKTLILENIEVKKQCISGRKKV